jgi:hypothetical protein
MFARFLSSSGRAPLAGVCRFAAQAVGRHADRLDIQSRDLRAVSRPSAADFQSGIEAKVIVNLNEPLSPVMPMPARDGSRVA